MENAQKNAFRISEIVKLTIKSDSSLSHINICYYLKLRIAVLHGDFFRRISENPQFLKTLCKDLNILFHFGCRKWIKKQFFEKKCVVVFTF